jgi:hypothetical protein
VRQTDAVADRDELVGCIYVLAAAAAIGIGMLLLLRVGR